MPDAIAEIAAALDRGDISAVELLDDRLRAYARWQPATNAFVELTADGAREQARASDSRRRRGLARGRLDGIPLAYKDMFDRRGRCASFGSKIGQMAPASSTSLAIGRLERAGAVTLGFLNMSEFALGPTGHNATFGHCRNPWDGTRISGGSSSGAGAAVAAGIVLGAVGSDTGGSIRIPASCCGVTGLKTSQGLIGARGALALAPSLDCFGPLARSAADCAVLLEALTLVDAGHIARSPKLVFPVEDIGPLVAPDVAAALTAAVAAFVEAGAQVRTARLPDISALHELADRVQAPESAAAHAERLSARRGDYTPQVLARIAAGYEVSAQSYIEALGSRAAHRRALIDTVLGDADALILPTIGAPVPRIVDTDVGSAGAPALIRAMTHWTRWLSYLGLPAVSIPCGFDVQGLPIGMQLVGRLQRDRQLLALADLFQSLTDWHLRAPTEPAVPIEERRPQS